MIFPATAPLFCVAVLIATFFASGISGEADNNVPKEMNKKLAATICAITETDQLTRLAERYGTDDTGFHETYGFTASFSAELVGVSVDLGSIDVGYVHVHEPDTIYVHIDPPLSRWDMDVFFLREDDSVQVDSAVAFRREFYYYNKVGKRWRFARYRSNLPREEKTVLVDTVYPPVTFTVLEAVCLGLHGRMDEVERVICFGDDYEVRQQLLNARVNGRTDLKRYGFEWEVKPGEEMVRLHSIEAVGLESENRFIPLTGTLEFTWVNFIRIDVMGLLSDTYNCKSR